MGNASLIKAFANELDAHRYFETLRWPDGPVCLRCNSRKSIGRLDGASTRIGIFKCYECRRQFCITHGTIFEKSHVPLHKWFQAIYLMNMSGGVRTTRLAAILNVSWKTAFALERKLLDAFGDEDTELLPRLGLNRLADRESDLSLPV
ncbi:MAG: transposase [Proteobacteria bacterium]|nr:transposase [Pseudomonadota bacterium]